MSIKQILSLCTVLCACFLIACGGGGGEKTSMVADPEALAASQDATLFAMTPEEQHALAIDDDSALVVEFGDSSLGPVSFESPPSFAQIASMQGLAGATRGTSTTKCWDWTKKCKKHWKKYCKSCNYKKCDHCDKASCAYKDDKNKCDNPCKKCGKNDCKDKGNNCKNPCKGCGKDDCKDKGNKCKNPCKGCGKDDCKDKGDKCKNPCKGCDKSDCNDKGDKCKNPCKGCGKNDCKDKGDKCKNPCKKCTKNDCKHKGDKCTTPPPPECPPPPPPPPCPPPERCLNITGICNTSERFWKVDDCCDTATDVTYTARVEFDNPEPEDDLSGVEVIFSRDGQEIGRADTDENGVATHSEAAVERGHHTLTVCVAEGSTGNCSDNGNCGNPDCPTHNGSGTTAVVVVPNPGDCGCPAGTNSCTSCSSTPSDGKFCAAIDFAVYTDCIQGAVTGTGYIPTCDPLRVGLRDHMNFRLAYDQGAVQGVLNYSGGQYAGARRIVNGQVKWLLIAGAHSWFGGDNFMVHVIDGGKTFTQDSFEIWINDPVTCTCYHCGGNLVGCYVNISWRYSQKCP